MRDPLRLFEPEPGASEPFLASLVGVFSRMTSIFGVSGALISGTPGFFYKMVLYIKRIILIIIQEDKENLIQFLANYFSVN
jgi:hypothetical protein